MDSRLIEHLSRFILSRGKDFVPTMLQRVARTVSTKDAAVRLTTAAGAAAVGFIAFFNRKKLDEALTIRDETFSQMLCRKIREKGMSHAECYKKAHIDRRTFSKILSDIHYKPQKKTAIAFAIALELPLEEAEELLMKAGFAFSDNQEFDLIIQYFIKNQTYDIFTINQALLYRDQPLLVDG